VLLDIEDEEVDRLVGEVLKRYYTNLRNRVDQNDFLDLHESDQIFLLRSLDGLEQTLEYLLPPNEAKMFLDQHKGE